MLKLIINNKNYENCIEHANLSGSTKDSARKIEFTIITNEKIDIGDKVEFFSNNSKIFIGTIFKISKNKHKEKIIASAFDNAISLNRSKFLKNFFEKTPSQISKEILGELNMKFDEMPPDATKCTFYAFDRSGYDIISRAYELQQKKTNKEYFILAEDGKIKIIENGEEIPDLTLDSRKNIKKLSYSKSTENIVNKIIYYQTGKNGKQIINSETDVESINKFGVFQELVEKQDQVDNFLDSSKFLKKVEENAQLTVLGNEKLKSGYIISIKVDSKPELTGKFLIENDTHVWKGSEYTTTLSLKFNSIKEGK